MKKDSDTHHKVPTICACQVNRSSCDKPDPRISPMLLNRYLKLGRLGALRKVCQICASM